MGTMLQSSDVTVEDSRTRRLQGNPQHHWPRRHFRSPRRLAGTMLMGSETGAALTVNPLASTPSITKPIVAAGTVSVTPPVRTSKIAPRW
ncbi:hypothetical protein JCM18909_2409 [Cutibacterium acnes JCM 18909]|nr:hypothetical protein JCM18909_2409 [Cutibacterium acnes JCM 18909]